MSKNGGSLSCDVKIDFQEVCRSLERDLERLHTEFETTTSRLSEEPPEPSSELDDIVCNLAVHLLYFSVNFSLKSSFQPCLPATPSLLPT
jgi:hypothetical protein